MNEPVAPAARHPWLLAALSGLLYCASFPPLDLGAVAFVALAPLFLALRGASRARAFLVGWLAGTVAICPLVAPSIHEAAARYFGGGGAALVLFALIVPQIHGALYFGAFALLARGWERRSAPAALVLLAATWTATEFARASIGYGSPWVLLGHSQHARLWLAQSADLGGVFAVTFVVAAVNAGVAQPAAGPGRIRGAAAATLVLLAVAFAYGNWCLTLWDPSRREGSHIEVAAVQPDLPLSGRMELTALPRNLHRLIELTRVATMSRPADLVVWPENAVGFSVSANESLLAQATGGLGDGSRLLLGAPREVSQEGSVVFRNSAFLIDRGGAVTGVYDKMRLTPFAETSPWTILPFLQRRFGAADIYTPGEKLALFEVKGSRFAVLICYEAIYPDLARAAVLDGARFLVNISNDDWFGGRAALAQHLQATLFRAIETRRFLVRATNSGLSAVVDPRGEVIAAVPPAVPTALGATVVAIDEVSPYVRLGDAFAWTCVGLALLMRWLWREKPAPVSRSRSETEP